MEGWRKSGAKLTLAFIRCRYYLPFMRFGVRPSPGPIMLIIFAVAFLAFGAIDFTLATFRLATPSRAARIMRRRQIAPDCRWAKRWAGSASLAMRGR